MAGLWLKPKTIQLPKRWYNNFPVLGMKWLQRSATTSKKQITKSATTKVKFAPLTDAEIDFYIVNFAPYDKAGAYGIQEWIGAIGVEAIEGSYNNVVGLPTHLVYKT